MANKERLNKITQIANNEEAAVALFNANVDKVNRAIEDSLSRTNAQPNNMKADLDMGDNAIINMKMRPIEKRDDGDVVIWGEIKDFTGASKRAEDAAVKAEGWKNEAKEAADLSSARASDSEDFADLSKAWAVADDFDDRLEGESSSKAYSNLAMAIANAPEDTPVNLSELQSTVILKGDSATVKIANVSTLPAGREAYVRNIGNERDAVFEIGLPRAENDHYAQGNLGDIRSTAVIGNAPEGCAWCDGAWYSEATYPDMYKALVEKRIATIASSSYDSQVSSNGCCMFFVIDTAGKRFRVPTMKNNLMFSVAKGVEQYGVYRQSGLPNITGWGYTGGEDHNRSPDSGAPAGGALYSYRGHDSWRNEGGGYGDALILAIDASRSSAVYGRSSTVQPEAVQLNYYVVLSEARKSIYTPKESVETFADLPKTGNILGDTRVALDTGLMYVWAQTLKGSYTWTLVGSAGSSAGAALAEWGSIEGDITQQADLQEALSKKLENTSTYNNSFSVGAGAVTQSTSATSIGVSSSSKGSATAVGYQANAAATGSVAVGRESHAQDSYSVAVGYQAKTPGGYSIAVGPSSEAGDSAVALGSGARALAEDSIQIGVGTNEEEGSLKVLDKKLLDAKGHIPPDRLLRTPASLTLNAKQKEIAEEFGVYFAENSVDASLIQDGHFFDSDEGLLKAAVTRYNWDTKINPYYNYSSMSWSVLKFKNRLFAFGDSFRNGTYYCELWTSDDGKTWTRNTNVTDLKSIVVASDSVMVCVTNAGSLKVSDNGGTWADAVDFTGTNVSALWYGGGVFLAKGAGNSLYVSANGSVWNSVELVDTEGSALSNFDGISFDGTKFIMYASYGNLYTSSDGVNWTKNTSLSRVDFVEYKDGIYVAGKQKTSGATQMYYSTDLNEWTPTSVVKGWGNYASFVVGDYYLIVSQASTEDYMYVSKDGLNWIELEYPKGYYRSPFAYADGVYYTTAYKPNSTSYGLLGRSEIADAKATLSPVLCSLEDIAVAGDNIKFTAETKPNYSVVGRPTIEDNVASDFNYFSGLTTENPFVAEECTRVEMVLVFEQSSLVSNPIVSNEIPVQAPYFRVNTSQTGNIALQYTDTSGQNKTFAGALGLTANTKTWYKCIGDVSDGTFTQFKSTDEGSTWTLIGQLSGFTSPSLETGSLLYWGKYGQSTTYLNGKIYLEDCYIKTTSASGERTLKLVEETGKTEVSVPLTGYLKNEATGNLSIGIGHVSEATGSHAIAVGYNASATANDAIQLGSGTNSNEGSFQVGLYQLLDVSGKIPAERLPDDIGGGATSLEDIAVAGKGIMFTNPPSVVKAYTVTGAPTFLSDGEVRGFSDSNYLTASNPINAADPLDSFEIYTAIKKDSVTPGHYGIIDVSGTSGAISFRLTIAEARNSLRWRASTDGNQTYPIDIIGSTVLEANKKYFVKVTYSSASGYTLFSSVDGIEWTPEGTSSVLTRPYKSSFNEIIIGDNAASGLSFDGSLYLGDTYINVNGKRVWTAWGEVDKAIISTTVDLTGYLKNSKANFKYGLGIGLGNVPDNALGIAIGTGDQPILAEGQGAIAIGSAGQGETYPTYAKGQGAIAIGKNARATSPLTVAMGFGANASGVAIGYDAEGVCAVGYYAKSTGAYSAAIGPYAKASGAKSIAVGESAVAGADNAIQLGTGTNSTARTLSVGLGNSLNVRLLNANGKIPGERMSLQGTTAPDTTTVGSIGQFYVDTATGTGYMCVGVADGVYTWKQITV